MELVFLNSFHDDVQWRVKQTPPPVYLHGEGHETSSSTILLVTSTSLDMKLFGLGVVRRRAKGTRNYGTQGRNEYGRLGGLGIGPNYVNSHTNPNSNIWHNY